MAREFPYPEYKPQQDSQYRGLYRIFDVLSQMYQRTRIPDGALTHIAAHVPLQSGYIPVETLELLNAYCEEKKGYKDPGFAAGMIAIITASLAYGGGRIDQTAFDEERRMKSARSTR